MSYDRVSKVILMSPKHKATPLIMCMGKAKLCCSAAKKMVCTSLETSALYTWRFRNLDSLS